MVLGGRTFSGVVFKVINETRNRGVLQERLDWLQGSDHAALIRDGLRGLEKENLRVDDKGLLSVRQHPITQKRSWNLLLPLGAAIPRHWIFSKTYTASFSQIWTMS